MFAEMSAKEILEPYLPMVENANSWPSTDTDKNNELTKLMNALQIYIASLGSYDKETFFKYYGTYEPGNYFTTYYLDDSKMKKTFNGVCQDYAQAMQSFLETHAQEFEEAGLAFVKPDPELSPNLKYYRIWYAGCSPEKPNIIQISSWNDNAPEEINFSTGGRGITYTKNITPHKDSKGEPATNHAWIWVQYNDSTYYWFDPTWTDGTGKLHWGYVDLKKKEEIQLGGQVSKWAYDVEAKKRRNAKFKESLFSMLKTKIKLWGFRKLKRRNNSRQYSYDKELSFRKRRRKENLKILKRRSPFESIYNKSINHKHHPML